ncbi:UDP-sugar transporter [Striga asiatica]|uniref:UDP-sugar transporter n=1 Tax=Striga asiatica TaxID=4170 RepID=A0A5A7P5U7_STRAF|nr:UDP-sugar transporter [Striga asiatica]
MRTRLVNYGTVPSVNATLYVSVNATLRPLDLISLLHLKPGEEKKWYSKPKSTKHPSKLTGERRDENPILLLEVAQHVIEESGSMSFFSSLKPGAGLLLPDSIHSLITLSQSPTRGKREPRAGNAIKRISLERGCGAGIVLTSPEKVKSLRNSIHLFLCTNNVAEYEACTTGLKLALSLGASVAFTLGTVPSLVFCNHREKKKRILTVQTYTQNEFPNRIGELDDEICCSFQPVGVGKKLREERLARRRQRERDPSAARWLQRESFVTGESARELETRQREWWRGGFHPAIASCAGVAFAFTLELVNYGTVPSVNAAIQVGRDGTVINQFKCERNASCVAFTLELVNYGTVPSVNERFKQDVVRTYNDAFTLASVNATLYVQYIVLLEFRFKQDEILNVQRYVHIRDALGGFCPEQECAFGSSEDEVTGTLSTVWMDYNMDQTPYLSLFAAVSYGVASMGMVFINKAVLMQYAYSMTLLTLQQLMTTVLIRFGRTMGYTKARGFNVETAKRLLLVSLFYNANVAFALASLKGVNIPMYIAIKRLTPLAVLVAGFFYGKGRPTTQVTLSVLLTAAGVLIAALGDFSFDLFGYGMAFTSVFFQTMYLVLVEKSGAEDGLSSVEIMFYNSILSLPFLFILIIATGEFPNSMSILFAKV